MRMRNLQRFKMNNYQSTDLFVVIGTVPPCSKGSLGSFNQLLHILLASDSPGETKSVE